MKAQGMDICKFMEDFGASDTCDGDGFSTNGGGQGRRNVHPVRLLQVAKDTSLIYVFES